MDVFHAVGHLADLARAAWGDAAAARVWLDQARRALVADRWAGVCQFLATQSDAVTNPGALRVAIPAVANYLLGHRDRLHYAARFACGQAIGSGLVEGTIKQRVGRWMKRSGARWLARHVGPFVELAASADSAEWKDYWKAPANTQRQQDLETS